MQLGSQIAVAVVQDGNHSSDWTPSARASIFWGAALEKTKRQKQTNKQTNQQKTIKEEITGINLCYPELGNGFLDKTPKA